MVPVGQTFMHSPHLKHLDINSSSAKAPGGLINTGRFFRSFKVAPIAMPVKKERINFRRAKLIPLRLMLKDSRSPPKGQILLHQKKG